MGVEACDDCGGQVADSAETCPHCGSNANHLRRLKPLQEEEAKRLEALERSANKGCLIVVLVVAALVLGLVIWAALAPEEEYSPAYKRCIVLEKNSGSSDWTAINRCQHLRN